MPGPGNINAAFTLEGEDAYECGQIFHEFLKELTTKHKVSLSHMRYDFHERGNPTNRLGGTLVDKREPSEASKGASPFPVQAGEKKIEFKGGKDAK